jgi:hypothetical protein
MKNLKVLVFTSSYGKRPYMLRQSIHDVRNQTYKNLIHAVNVTLEENSQTKNFLPMYRDLLSDKLIVSYNKNSHSHFNNMIAIKSVPNWEDYDIFLKMDDDDIHKSHYVENVVKFFENNLEYDIVSTYIKYQLNGHDLYLGKFDNLGANPEGTDYHMPMTFAFTRKALDVIINLTDMYHYDDYVWRYEWTKAGLLHHEVDNENEVIWHLHGKNWSAPEFLRKPEEYVNLIS